MRRPSCAILLLVVPSLLGAQASAPNCRLSEPRRDMGMLLPRWEFHALRVTAATVGVVALHKVLKLPAWAASIVPAGVSVGLHVDGVRRGEYRVNARDWALDALVVSAPAFYLLGRSGHSWQASALSLTTYGAGVAALWCYGSP